MVFLALLIASAVGLALVLGRRREESLSTAGPLVVADPAAATSKSVPSPAIAPRDPAALAALAATNAAVGERLWRLGYAASSAPAGSSERMDQLVRNNVAAILQVDVIDHDFFPRRPALLPQLLQAIDDPRTASDKLARMIAHDPVLVGDVLRTANSPMYRTSSAPIESIQRAIAVCGVDALRAILAIAMVRPVFRATSKNFPRLPRVLWDRTERAARAAELYAAAHLPQDRFECQLVVLLNALGPLVVHSALLDVYARNPLFPPNAALCVALTAELAPRMSQRIAWDWQTSRRLLAALEASAVEPLTEVLLIGELLGTLSFLESQTVISPETREEFLLAATIPRASIDAILPQLDKRA